MNRPIRASISGIIVGAVCVGLIALPNAFNPHGDDAAEFNERLRLAGFLSLAMPGLGLSLLLGHWAKRRMRRYAVTITWCASALLAVALPAPAIVHGSWGDGMIGWYILIAVIAGGLWGWGSPPLPSETFDREKDSI